MLDAHTWFEIAVVAVIVSISYIDFWFAQKKRQQIIIDVQRMLERTARKVEDMFLKQIDVMHQEILETVGVSKKNAELIKQNTAVTIETKDAADAAHVVSNNANEKIAILETMFNQVLEKDAERKEEMHLVVADTNERLRQMQGEGGVRLAVDDARADEIQRVGDDTNARVRGIEDHASGSLPKTDKS